MVEVNCAAIEVQNLEWNPVQAGSQDLRGEKEINWEESSLAKFSKFLGFSTEGLEKEILGFLSKIRKDGKGYIAKGCWRNQNLKGSVQSNTRGVSRKTVI